MLNDQIISCVCSTSGLKRVFCLTTPLYVRICASLNRVLFVLHFFIIPPNSRCSFSFSLTAGYLVIPKKRWIWGNTLPAGYILLPVAAGARKFGGGGNKLKARAIWSKLLDPFFFFFYLNVLWTGIFVKIKPNVLSSGDIALASTLISTCLSTDELLLSGTRVVENGPITWGQTYKNNIDSL